MKNHDSLVGGQSGCCGHAGAGPGRPHGHEHHQDVVAGPGDEVVICAVRGNATLRSSAEASGLVRDVSGQRYFFCCRHCMDLFDADPTAAFPAA